MSQSGTWMVGSGGDCGVPDRADGEIPAPPVELPVATAAELDAGPRGSDGMEVFVPLIVEVDDRDWALAESADPVEKIRISASACKPGLMPSPTAAVPTGSRLPSPAGAVRSPSPAMPTPLEPPLSVIIPALDAEATLPATLAALAEGHEAGLLRECIVVDGGSHDRTAGIARRAGARLISAARGRGAQLALGAASASGDWLLFLHADTRPARGWSQAAAAFLPDAANQRRAAYLRFRLDDKSAAARRLEALVAWRCRRFALPYGDQGVLISAALYREIGGFRPLPLMEDVDLARRLGRGRLVPLAADAVTSAERYRRGGYVARPLRNLGCLALYFLGVPPPMILRLYR